MPIEVLYTFIITCLILIITPGPDLLYVVSQSIAKGRKFGYAIVIGQMGGLLFHLSLFAFGVSALIIKSAIAFQVVKIVGAAYLFWLAVKVFQEENVIALAPSELPEAPQDKSILGFVKTGMLMNILNPKVMMFFLALFPGFISEQNGNIKQQVFILGGVFITEALASQLATAVQGNKVVNAVLKWLQIVLFTALGIYLLLS